MTRTVVIGIHDFEQLLEGESIICSIDEQIVYNQLDDSEEAIWSLLLASGDLKVLDYQLVDEDNGDYNDFSKALLREKLNGMSAYMKRVTLRIYSYFYTRRDASQEGSERFYHGFAFEGKQVMIGVK